MSISEPFIRRPVATTLLLVALILAGGMAYRLLPAAALPAVDFPTVTVFASLPGASPEVMAAAVATPLEKQFTRIAGVTEMTSNSSVGSASVTLQFDLSRDINAAARDVQAAINASIGFLPSNLPQLPKYRKINPADAPILLLTLESDVVPRPQLYDIASSLFAQKLAQVPGVGQVQVGGSSLPAVRIEVNPQPLSNYNVGLDQIGSFLQRANANTPKGALANDEYQIPLYASDQLFDAKDYRNLIPVYRNGAPIRLSDLGRVVEGTEDIRNLGIVNGSPMVQIQISRQPNANIIETVARIKAMMPQLQADLPPTVRFKVAQDRTATTRDSLKDAQINVIIAIGLVVLVVLLFLRSLRSTFIPSVVVPVSIIATFGAMYLIGYTLDNLSLMALTVATGFVVDDAIVVIENITRHLETGLTPLEAALKGAEEIGFTVLSMSISLVAVFIPILMMSGIVGRLFREFAVVLSVSIIVSMIVSLTVTPMMCAWLLKQHRKDGVETLGERIFNWIVSTYASALDVALRHPAVLLVTVFLTLGVNVYLYVKIPKGFFPQQDTGRLNGNVVGEQHISYQALVEKAKWFEEQVRTDPDVQTVTMVAGTSGGGFGGNSANINVQLKPVGERKSTSDQVLARLRRKTAGMPGATMFLQNSQDVRIGGRQGNAQYQYTLQGPDFASLAEWGPKMLARLQSLPEIADVSSDQQTSGLSSNVVIDRDTASRLGLTAQAVDAALYDAFGQRQVSVMYKAINQYHVVLALEQRWWESPNFLNTIYVQTPKGTDVPLSTFTHFTEGITPIRLTHQGQFPATTFSFNLASDDVSLSDAVSAIKTAEIDAGLPTTITGKFAGTAQAYQQALANQPILVGTALLAVYIVLGMLYESLIHPLTIISTLPSAGVGALVAMVLCRTNLDIIGMIGIILLIGLVKKNAIMMIDFALAAERTQSMGPREAIYQACLLRFRPIMMTTTCALLGAMPMALGWGAGAELRKPLGISIVGGLLVSQMMTLFTTPVIYLYLDRLRLSLSWRKSSYRNRPSVLVPGGVASGAVEGSHQ
jgi:multidrug efflux pump